MRRKVMSYRLRIWVLASAAFVALFTAMPGNGQTSPKTTSQIPRMPDGKPNFTGLWQTLGTAHWDIRDHSTQPGPFFQLGGTGAMPAGQGMVEVGEIPYTRAPAARKKETLQNRRQLTRENKYNSTDFPTANH